LQAVRGPALRQHPSLDLLGYLRFSELHRSSIFGDLYT
jgi:hypothetical protein